MQGFTQNLTQNLTQTLTQKLAEFKSNPDKVKQALSATGAVVIVAGGLFGLKSMFKNRPKPTIKHLAPAMSHYLEYNEDWYFQIAALSDFGHFSQAAFERLSEAVAFLIYVTADLETRQNYSKLYTEASLIAIVVESIRVIRAHVYQKYGSVDQVMLEFDEIAGNMQQLCNDTQYNVDNILHYQKLTK